MTDYEAKFHELGQPINRVVATVEPWTPPEESETEAEEPSGESAEA